jgi:hypothetical protein
MRPDGLSGCARRWKKSSSRAVPPLPVYSQGLSQVCGASRSLVRECRCVRAEEGLTRECLASTRDSGLGEGRHELTAALINSPHGPGLALTSRSLQRAIRL